MILQGTAASGGIGIGSAVLIIDREIDYSGVQYSGREPEKTRLRAAVDTFTAATQAMAEKLTQSAGSHEGDILLGQITMLNDPFMLSQMDEAIDSGAVAEAAADSVCSMYVDMFSGVDDEMMRQRATDVRDIRSRLLKIMLGIEDTDISTVPNGSIIAAHDLTPSMTVGLKKGQVSALLAEVGGKTSHSAILARALAIPAVLGAADLMKNISSGELLIVDGDSGEIISGPDEMTLSKYKKLRDNQLLDREALRAYIGKPTITSDGRRVDLYANIGSAAEAQAALDNGAEGIGLFRTEFIFMDRSALPTEEEQYSIYSSVASLMDGREVIIRTLDIGGDKAVPYLGLEREDNPFLGYRAIRYCLQRTDVFETQLRALLRAGALNPRLKIMLPLITGLEELRRARSILEKCKSDLKSEGKAYNENIALGIMVETPAAALISDLLAKESDFFSIGTNDLTQYTVAVDRGNARVEYMYSPLHPAVLRSIKSIIGAAKAAGIPVGMCGEAAADKRMIPLLVSFGLDEFSVGASSVLPTRRAISQYSTLQAAHIADEVMKLSDTKGIAGYLSGICED